MKVNGQWCYLYRAADKAGNTVDFYISKKRDKKVAMTFLKKARTTNGLPEKIAIDKSGANIAAIDQLNSDLKAIGKKGVKK